MTDQDEQSPSERYLVDSAKNLGDGGLGVKHIDSTDHQETLELVGHTKLDQAQS